MLPFKEKRVYTLQRDYRVLEREKRVSKILGNHAFRSELEGILQGQLDGSRGRPKLSQALRDLQDNVAPAAAVEAAHGRGSVGGPRAGAGPSVIPVNDLRGARSSRYVLFERQLRCKLASLCRLVDWFKWSQLLDNHISARGGAGERGFLVNPFGLLYSEVTASNLLRVSRDGTIVDGGSTQLGVNPRSIQLHSTIYSARKDVHCVMHLNTVAGAAVSGMKCGLLPISEEALSLGKVSYYTRSPAGHSENRKELAKALGKNKVLILCNHGLVAVGNSVEDCFHVMYNLIKACQIQVAAVSAGLSNLTQFPPGETGSLRVEGGNKGVPGAWGTKGQMEFEALMRKLDNCGYQTGYKYRGLSLLEDPGDRRRQAAWDDVMENGEGRGRSLQATELRLKARKEKEVWSFLDDDRSRDKPLTKNTKIRVKTGPRGGVEGVGRGDISPVEEVDEEADPWQFLTSRESSVISPGSKGDSRPSTAQRTVNTSGEREREKGGRRRGSGTGTEDSRQQNSSSIGGRRRLRHRRKSNSNTSSRTHGTDSSPHHNHSLLAQFGNSNTGALSTGDTPLPPLDLTVLEQTAERVAHSTGAAVEKLSQRKLGEKKEDNEGEGMTHSEPELTSTWEGLRRDPRHSRLMVDSQGYSSGDEGSYLGSPRRPTQSSAPLTETLLTTLQYDHNNPTPPPSLPSLPPPPLSDSSISPPHPPPSHIPLHISYPPGASSAEKAALVARLVANSTGAAVKKLSENMTEKRQLSLTTTDSPPSTSNHTAQI